jgi:hypothetical protein
MSHNLSFQKHYQPYIGSAILDKTHAVVGTVQNVKLTYTVGKHGIDETGALKVLFRIASDIGRLQFNDLKTHNYVQATTSNKKVQLQISGPATGCRGKQHERPWSQGFTIHVTESFLQEGDEVFVQFTNFHMQTYSENQFEFRLAVDPFATGKYIQLENSPFLKILPGKPSSLHLIVPSKTEPTKKYTLFAKVEDSWGNVCNDLSGELLFENVSEHIHSPDRVKLINGKGECKLSFKQEGVYWVKATLGKLKATSNPTRCTTDAVAPYFWADLHGQSNETVGTNTIDDYYSFAKNYGHLDITCHQGNDFQISNDLWNTINQTSKKYNEEGSFIAFPGYEWSGNTSVGGDHNVIYKCEGLPIYRSSHALVSDMHDVDSDASTVVDLFNKLDHANTFLISHVGGRYADLNQHNSDTQPDAVEIHSDWGTFEWILQDAFAKGMRVGVVANSDGHKGTPGASYPGSSHFGSQGGLTSVRAQSLTRDDIFNALKARHTYATTGARIILDVTCRNSSDNNFLGEAGDIIHIADHSNLLIDVIPTAPIERVELYQKNRIIKTFYPELKKKKDQKIITLLWSGATSKGRSRKLDWNGKIHFKSNSLGSVEKIHFYSDSNTISTENGRLEFSGTTTGGVQGLILSLKKETGSLHVELNGKKIELLISAISQKPKTYKFGALSTKLDIYETSKNTSSREEFNTIFNLKEIPEVDTPYFVKVIQRDGHMAWSSPMYISKK